jgi:ribosome maturation protein SDO1
MPGGPTFDQERVQLNLVRLRKGGENFEVVVDPDRAIAFRETAGDDNSIRDLLKAEKVFSDAKKGLLASETHMRKVFDTTDTLTIARHLLEEGDIQITQEHREKIRQEKRRKLIHLIHINAIDPKTNNPHPEKRVELAFDEAKVKIDEFRKAEDQVAEVVKQLTTVLPIRFERTKLRIKLPADMAAKVYGTIQHYATIRKEDWQKDGAWLGIIELPAGLRNDLIDELNSKTHGDVHIDIVKE